MKLPSKQTPRNILSSLDEHEFRQFNDQQTGKIDENIDQEIFYYQKSNHRNRIESASQKISHNEKNTPKKSQRYLKGNKEKTSQLFFSKTYDQNFFSCSKKVQQKNEDKQQHKTISTYEMFVEKQKDPRVIQLALRYGVYNKISKNLFNQNLKKRTKKSTNPYHVKEEKSKLSIETNNDQQLQNILQKNKKTSQIVDAPSSKFDQNYSLMLDRKHILPSDKDSHAEKNQGNFFVTEQKKNFIDYNKIGLRKNGHKIHLFINEKIECETQNLKIKSNKKQMTKACFNDFPVQNGFIKSNYTGEKNYNQTRIRNKSHTKKWWSKMYFPQNQKQLKEKSFITEKNTSQRNYHKNKQQQKPQILKGKKSNLDSKRNQTKISIIPDSIIFKKKQSYDDKKNIIGKIVKNMSKQIYANQQRSQVIKSFLKNQNSVSLLGNMESKIILQKKMRSKDIRPSTEGSPNRRTRQENYAIKNPELTFVFDSKDHQYIAEYLISNGWNIFVPNKINPDWTFKWVNNPVSSEILKLKDGQFYNHFHKSYELTSKSFLSFNLRANQHFLKTDDFFPETFDIGNEIERNEYIKKFKYNTIMILLQNIVGYCFKKGKIHDLYKRFMKYEVTDDIIESQSQKKLQNQYFNVIEFQNYRHRNENFQINVFLVILMLKYLRKQRMRYDIDLKEKKNHFLKFKKEQFESNFELLQFYSKKQDVSRSQDQKGLFSYHFATPSDLLLQILVKQYWFFSKLNKWKYDLESGVQNASNIWIIKPSSNARGNGIYLETNLGSILKSAKDIQSRIVQKYIEKPLLFKNTPNQYLNNHKFDIRQWVLLKSLDPLEIYMFSHFYIRLASDKYDLYPIENNKAHLTNFSANKEFFDNQQNSIVSSDELVRYLRHQYGIDYQSFLKPKIKEIIIKSLQSCQQKLQAPQNGTSFELLGYDIFIDQQFHPWLIEVNMSPACEQRTPWLAEYLKNMNEELLEIVLPQSHISKSKNAKRKQLWQRILFQEYHFNAKDCNAKLEIVSTNLQNKNKLLKQIDGIKQKKSIDNNPSSPSKIKPQNHQKITIRKQSVSRVIKQNIDEDKQTLQEQINKTRTISQIDLDCFDDYFNYNSANDDTIQKMESLEEINHIAEDLNDAFSESQSIGENITNKIEQFLQDN